MKYKAHICAFLLAAMCACTNKPENVTYIDVLPPITPDYIDVTMPINMAAPRFELPDSCNVQRACAIFSAGDEKVEVMGKGAYIAIPLTDWRKLTASASEIKVELLANIDGSWISYQPFEIHISPDSIDSHLAYRLIEPGYETWNEMGIYQRCLETYDEKEILSNRRTDYGCINCHSFCDRNPDKMLMHMRMNYPGTYIVSENEARRVKIAPNSGISSLVYPSWHPSGDFAAFSTNDTKQLFHTSDPNRIEVMDYASDVVVLDTRTDEILTSPLLSSAAAFETFPAFSPDGRTLYFCSAESADMPAAYADVKYSVCSIAFDPATRTFGTKVDTVYNARALRSCNAADTLCLARQGAPGSASFPRVSPDGRFLMITLSSYGNFSIWHRDADIYLIDLADGKVTAADAINSPEAESYHSWSSNGRWVVVSSRRNDGLYTRPYFAHIAPDGSISKPFILPQDGKSFYRLQMKSYNIPEFIISPVPISPSHLLI